MGYKIEILFQLCFLCYSYPYTCENYNLCSSNSPPVFAFPSTAEEVKTGSTSEQSRLMFLWWKQIWDNILEVKLRPRRLKWPWWRYVLYFGLISCDRDMFCFSDWSPTTEICFVFLFWPTLAPRRVRFVILTSSPTAERSLVFWQQKLSLNSKLLGSTMNPQ